MQHGIARQRGITRATLAAVFILAFGLPVLGVWLYVRGAPTKSQQLAEDLERISVRLDSSGPRVVFRESSDINPRDDKTLVIFSSFRLRSLPNLGDRVALFSKAPTVLGSSNPIRRGPEQGFAVALVNDQGVYRFMLSWPTEDGARWMRFSEVSIAPENWFVFALAIRANGSVGAFYVPIEPERSRPPRFILLGGLSLESAARGASQAPFILAPGAAGRFIARIGPFGVLRGENLEGREGDVIRSLVEGREFGFPELVSRNQVALFWSGGPRALGTDDSQTYNLEFEKRG